MIPRQNADGFAHRAVGKLEPERFHFSCSEPVEILSRTNNRIPIITSSHNVPSIAIIIRTCVVSEESNGLGISSTCMSHSHGMTKLMHNYTQIVFPFPLLVRIVIYIVNSPVIAIIGKTLNPPHGSKTCKSSKAIVQKDTCHRFLSNTRIQGLAGLLNLINKISMRIGTVALLFGTRTANIGNHRLLQIHSNAIRRKKTEMAIQILQVTIGSFDRCTTLLIVAVLYSDYSHNHLLSQ